MYKFIYKLLVWLDTKGIVILCAGIEDRVQHIFNKVIEAKHYSEDNWTFMCIALEEAMIRNTITQLECEFAKKEIKRYLGSEFVKLSGKLYVLNYPCKFEDRLAIYKNWKNRPLQKRLEK